MSSWPQHIARPLARPEPDMKGSSEPEKIALIAEEGSDTDSPKPNRAAPASTNNTKPEKETRNVASSNHHRVNLLCAASRGAAGRPNRATSSGSPQPAKSSRRPAKSTKDNPKRQLETGTSWTRSDPKTSGPQSQHEPDAPTASNFSLEDAYNGCPRDQHPLSASSRKSSKREARSTTTVDGGVKAARPLTVRWFLQRLYTLAKED